MLDAQSQNEYDHKVIYDDLFRRIIRLSDTVATVGSTVHTNTLTLSVAGTDTVFTSNGTDNKSVSIPLASVTEAGIIKVGENLTMGEDGVLNADAQKLNVHYDTVAPQPTDGEDGDLWLVKQEQRANGVVTVTTFNAEVPPTGTYNDGDVWIDCRTEVTE